MKVIDDKTIQLDRELSDLDKKVLQFVTILEHHVSYVIISGYVAILFGRSRGTEDVDVLIEKINQQKFEGLYSDLVMNGFWCINADNKQELFSMLNDGLAIRFAEKNKVIPNFEVKCVKDEIDRFTLNEKVKVITSGGMIFTSLIELQVAYKRYVLKSRKDLEDARHLQKLFNISEQNINKFQLLLKKYGRIIS